MSDISFNRTGSSSYKQVATGELNPNKVPNYYKYESIARCNVFLANIHRPAFGNEEEPQEYDCASTCDSCMGIFGYQFLVWRYSIDY